MPADGVLLLAFGGPTRAEEVRPFLANVLRGRSVPGVATYAVADSACEGVRVSTEAQPPRSDVALILCRGFAGTNAALLLRAAR